MKALFLFILLLPLTAEAAATRYTTATSDGATGTACSQAQRCTNKTAIDASAAGDTVSMKAGTMTVPLVYQGVNDMILPPSGRSGDALKKITVLCELDINGNDGGCILNGQFVQQTIKLNSNSFWVFQGFNVKNGTEVISIYSGSTDNIFSRIVAWDGDIGGNVAVVGIHGGARNLFEDFAAFGTGRKVFSNSQGGNSVRCTRCWFRWEGSTAGGALGVTIAYKSQDAIYENVLVTWSGESMPETYNENSTGGGALGEPRTNYEVTNSSLISEDRMESATVPKNSRYRILGSIAYTQWNAATQLDRIPSIPASTPGSTLNGIWLRGSSGNTITDVIRFMAPTHPRFNEHLGFALTRRPHNCPADNALCPTCDGGQLSANRGCVVPPGDSGGTEQPDNTLFRVQNNTATRLLSIRGTKVYGSNTGDSFGTLNAPNRANENDWNVPSANRTSSTTYNSATMNPWQNTATDRARLCYRTVNGVTGTTPLWPWPMNERIKNATRLAGKYAGPCAMNCATGGVAWMNGNTPILGPRRTRVETDVTQDIQDLLGTIPATCRNDGVTAPTFPDATGFLPAPLSTF